MSKVIKLLLVFLIAAFALSLIACSSEPISLSSDWIKPSKPMEVKWKVPKKLPKDAWIGFVRSDVPDDQGNHDDPNYEYKYLEGKKSGTFKFNSPKRQGKWDVRIYDADTGGKLIAKISFTVSNALEP